MGAKAWLARGGPWRSGRRKPESAGPQARGLVSIVVPIYNVEPYLDECLESIAAQTHRNVQVVLIDDGSTDGSAAIAQRYALADRRFELHRQPNAGLGATRNRGTRFAIGDFLYFLDSDDRLPQDAISRMVAAAQMHKADIVIGPLARFTSTRRWVPKWASELHASTEFYDSLLQRPELLRSHYAASKLYRRSFWTAQKAAFREGVVYEDQPLLTRLMIAAHGIVSLPDPVYDYRDRDDGSAIHQQVHTLEDLLAREQAWDAALAMFEEVDAPLPIRCAWLNTVYGTHLHYYLNSQGTLDPSYWRTLRGCLLRLDAAMPPGCTLRLDPGQELSLDLLRHDERASHERWWRAGAFDDNRRRYELSADGLRWSPRVDGTDAPSRPAAWEQLAVRTNFTQASWQNGGLDLHGHHYLRGLDLAEVPVRHELELVCDGQTHRWPAEVEADASVLPQAVVIGADHARGAFHAHLPASALVDFDGSVQLRVRSEFGPHTQTDPLPAGARWFSARHLPPALVDGRLLVPRMQHGSASIDISRPVAWITTATVAADGLRLHLAGDAAILRVGTQTTIRVQDGVAVIPTAALASLAGKGGTARLAVDDGGHLLAMSAELSCGPIASGVQLTVDTDGTAQLIAHTQHLELNALEFAAHAATVTVASFLASGRTLSGVALRSRAAKAVGRPSPAGWVIPLTDLPPGGYDLVGYVTAGLRTQRVRVGASLRYLNEVPTRHRCGEATWRTLVSESGFVHLDTPEARTY